MKRRRTLPTIAGLTTAQIEYLTTGRCPSDPFLPFDVDDAKWQFLWREHRDALTVHWHASGHTDPPWAATEFGEDATTQEQS